MILKNEITFRKNEITFRKNEINISKNEIKNKFGCHFRGSVQSDVLSRKTKLFDCLTEKSQQKVRCDYMYSQ